MIAHLAMKPAMNASSDWCDRMALSSPTRGSPAFCQPKPFVSLLGVSKPGRCPEDYYRDPLGHINGCTKPTGQKFSLIPRKQNLFQTEQPGLTRRIMLRKDKTATRAIANLKISEVMQPYHKQKATPDIRSAIAARSSCLLSWLASQIR
jgi:hypothetical protein